MQIRIADYPQLRLIAWNRHDDALVEEQEALALYERNWRFVDQEHIKPNEQALIQRLVLEYGHGVFNV